MYEGREALNSRTQVQALQQQQAPLTERLQRLQRERDNATQQLAALREDNERLKKESAELQKLRGQVGALRVQLADDSNAKIPAQPPLASARAYYERAMRHYGAHEYDAQFDDLK